MFDRFAKTVHSWFIVLLPTISALIIIVDKIVNLGFDSTLNKVGYVMFVLLISFLVDTVTIALIGALLNLCDEYERKDR